MQQEIVFDTFTDSRDGEVYKTVKIGNQIWMAENLRYKPNKSFLNKFGHNDPVFIDYREALDEIYLLIHHYHSEILEYDNLLKKGAIRRDEVPIVILKLIEIRRLHQKLELTTKKWREFGCLYKWTHHIKKYAPEGWKIPSNSDFLDLANFLKENECEVPAAALKSKSHWEKDPYYGCGGTDEFGFCVLPSGFFQIEKWHRNDIFDLLTDIALNVGDSASFWTRKRGAFDSEFNSSSSIYWEIRHRHRNEYPIEIQHEEDFFLNNFVCRDTYYAIRCIKEECSKEDSFVDSIYILRPPKPTFTVPECIEEDEPWEPQFGSFCDQRDNRTYRTVKIGNQEWFAEDLRYKSNSGLYTYDEAVKSLPEGWHLPSRIEVDELRDFCRAHSKNGFGTVVKCKTGWLPCTDYYATMNKRDFKEALKNSIQKAPFGTDRFGLSIAPPQGPQFKGKFARLWLDGSFGTKKYLWSFSYISDDHLIYSTNPNDPCIVRCVREI